MVPMPTFQQFIDMATAEYSVKDLSKQVAHNGQQYTIRYLERNFPDKRTARYVAQIPPEETMTPQMIRQACRRLEISLDHFGFHLG